MMRKVQFQKKLFLIIALFFLIMFSIAATGICIYAYHNSIVKTSILQKENVESYAGKIQQYINDMESISTQLVGNKTIQNVFLRAEDYNVNDNYFENNLSDKKRLEEECCAINIANNSVDAIYIYQRPYNFFGYNTERYNKTKVIQLLASNELDNYETKTGQFYRVSMPHEDLWTDGTGEKVISLFRPLTATYYGQEKIATIEVQKRYSRLEEIINDYGKDNDIKISIVDNDTGELIYPEEINQTQFPREYDVIRRIGDVQIVKTESGTKLAVYEYELSCCNWCIVGYQEYGTYMQSTKIIICLIAVLCIGFTVITLTGVFLVTRRLTRPIRELRMSLSDITLENVDINMDADSNNEIDLLRKRFQQVLSALQYSAKQVSISQTAEYQAKIDALQAQINPHFLYNSLMTISAAGQERDALKVQNMCSQLSDIFRYASEGGFDTTLKSEMDNVENYLNFMKCRYLDNLQFHIEKCKNLDAVHVPKLIIQPIIENSFKHGFYMVEPPYYIDIRCVINEDKWYVEISDNGGGIGQRELELIETQKQKIDNLFINKGNSIGIDTHNMALLNIYVRLRVKYQNEVIFSIKKGEEKGTIVCLGGKIFE